MASDPDQTSRPLYQYKPLRHEREIRLLKASKVSASIQQPLAFSLIHAIIENVPPYEPISYVWGPDARSHTLALSDGTVLHITENLDHAIADVVRHCSTGYLWIDQICINQADTTERNHQVKIMGQIYQAGFRVLAWLGRTDLPACPALDFVCSATNEALERNSSKEILLQHLQTLFLGDIALKNGQLTMYRDDRKLALWQLYKYLGSPWFSRAWVFQEIVLPRQSGVIMGSSMVSLSGLCWICNAMLQIEEDEILPVGIDDATISAKGFEIVPIMQQTWQSLHCPQDSQSSPYPSFYKLLSSITPKMKTSLPQDRIYAFLGLNQDPNTEIEPDYRNSGHETSVCAAKAIIQGSRRLDVFEYLCRLGDGDRERPFVRRLPTWAPDFTSREHVKPFSTSLASFQKNDSRFMYPHVGPCDLKTLVVHGKALDRIQTRIDPRIVPYTEGMYFDFSHYVNSAIRCWELSHRQVPKPTPQSVFAALLGQGHCDREVVARSLQQDGLSNMLLQVVRYYFDRLEVKPGASQEAISESWAPLKDAISAIYHVGSKRYLFVTESGRLALGCTLEPEDEVYILHGCSNPVALRPTKKGAYNIQETCFLEGWMDPWTSGMIDWGEDEGKELKLV